MYRYANKTYTTQIIIRNRNLLSLTKELLCEDVSVKIL